MKIIKRKGLIACLLSSMFGLLGCSFKTMPEGELVSVEYTRSGTMAGYQYEGRVEKDSTGAFVLRAMKEEYGPLFEKKIDIQTMNRFRQIIEEEKMYRYKEVYRPVFEVLDGWSWTFVSKFSDGSKIYSHGNNASPDDNGLSRIKSLMKELIEDGVQIETPKEE